MPVMAWTQMKKITLTVINLQLSIQYRHILSYIYYIYTYIIPVCVRESVRLVLYAALYLINILIHDCHTK